MTRDEEAALESDIIRKLADEYAGTNGWVKGGWMRVRRTGEQKDALDRILKRLEADGLVKVSGTFPEDRYSLTVEGVLRSPLAEKAELVLVSLHFLLRKTFEADPNFYLFSWAELKVVVDNGGLADSDLTFVYRLMQDAELATQSQEVNFNEHRVNWLIRSDTELLATARDHKAMLAYVQEAKRKKKQAEREFYERGVRALHHITEGEPDITALPIAKRKEVSLDISYLHPRVVEIAGALAEGGHLRNAVSEAFVALDDAIRLRTGLEGFGEDLMNAAFSAKSPCLRLAQNEAEQLGFMYLFKGAVKAVRNPYTHKIDVQPKSDAEAREWLAFASLLFRLIEQAEKIDAPATAATEPAEAKKQKP